MHMLLCDRIIYITSICFVSQTDQQQVYSSQISSNESDASLSNHMAGLTLDQNFTSSASSAASFTADSGAFSSASSGLSAAPSAPPLSIVSIEKHLSWISR